MNVLLADDHTLVRAGMRALLTELPGVQVVAETGDGQEALRLIGEKKPDLALIDISMPGLNGLEVAARARKEYPWTRIVILSMHVDDEFVRRALVSGAVGYILKDASRAELEMAVAAVARGETWLSPEVSSLIAEGLSNKEIASRLDVAVKTVETHRTELMERLGIHGVAGLVRYAIRVGLVHPES